MKLIFNNQNKIQPKIAVLVPAFNEETNIEYSYECLNNEINDLINNKIISDQSIIFYIDDGSKDKTLDKIKEVKKKNESKILAISLKKKLWSSIRNTSWFKIFIKPSRCIYIH